MILYNVTVKIDPEIKEDWLDWMTKEHIPEVVATKKFTDYRICRLLEPDESDGITYAIQYICPEMKDYEAYRDQYSENLQQKHLERYKNKFVAFRTLMEIIHP